MKERTNENETRIGENMFWARMFAAKASGTLLQTHQNQDDEHSAICFFYLFFSRRRRRCNVFPHSSLHYAISRLPWFSFLFLLLSSHSPAVSHATLHTQSQGNVLFFRLKSNELANGTGTRNYFFCYFFSYFENVKTRCFSSSCLCWSRRLLRHEHYHGFESAKTMKRRRRRRIWRRKVKA